MARRKKTFALDIEPHNPQGRQLVVKTLIGLIVGVIIAFLVFIILVLVGGMIQEALANRSSGNLAINPLLPLILIVISFVGTFIGNVIIAGVFNLVYTDKYYDMGKMFNATLLINVILFFFFIPLYLVFAGNIDQLFMILAAHIFLTIFMCYAGLEITTNPNYATSQLIGCARGLCVAIFMFAVVYKFVDVEAGSIANILLALPPVLGYTCLPLFQTLREKIYYKFYSMGNNFLYTPSLNEVMVDAEDDADIHVSM